MKQEALACGMRLGWRLYGNTIFLGQERGMYKEEAMDLGYKTGLAALMSHLIYLSSLSPIFVFIAFSVFKL